MRPISSPLPSAISLAIAGMLLQGIGTSASAQAPLQPTAQESQLPATTVTAPPPRSGRTDIAGWGPAPAWQQPAQAERFSDEAWKQAQVQRLADLIKLDASTSASYNAGGYWDFLSVRGFVLDVTHNYRREGLPISGETSIPLDNKAAVELLKGTSGMQAGVSSPGGLMNLIVKRPEGRTRDATLAFTGNGSILTSVDLGERFGQDKAFGLRVNAAHEHLHPSVQHAQGERHLLAWAADWRVKPGTLVEAEMEFSRRHQRSTAAFSLLDQQVPRPDSIDPDINLNNQAWAKPVMMKGVTGTMRLSHALNDDWKVVGTVGMQRLKTDDRMAFPYGGTLCVDPVYLYCDRFSPTGEFDLYDFRSENESRVTDTADVYASGKVRLGSSTHQLSVGAMRSLTRVDVPLAAFAWAGTGNITGDYTTPPNPTFDSAQNLRSERSTELYVRDSIAFTEDWRAWAGLRHTRLSRAQTPSNFTQGTSHAHENLTTPWLALGYQFAPQHQAYVSWGEGVELLLAKFSTPFVTYANSGLVLPAVKSRQWEMGVKAQQGQSHWSVNLFWIKKPEASTLPADATTVRFSLDGDARHQGLEGRFGTRVQNYTLEMSAIVMDAERRRSAKAGINGKAPTNVPDYALKMSHGWRLPALPGLTLQGDIVHEGPRTADAVNDIRIPAWTRLDASAAYVQALGQDRAITWRAGVTNVLDTRAWVESPTQFDHIYLFPMAQRTATLSMQLSF